MRIFSSRLATKHRMSRMRPLTGQELVHQRLTLTQQILRPTVASLATFLILGSVQFVSFSNRDWLAYTSFILGGLLFAANACTALALTRRFDDGPLMALGFYGITFGLWGWVATACIPFAPGVGPALATA